MRYLLAGLLVMMATTVWADPEVPTVVEDPRGAFELVKAFVDRLSPAAESVWNGENNSWHAGFSAAIVTFEERWLPVRAVRIGYAIDKSAYIYPNLDVLKGLNLLGGTVPDNVATILSHVTLGPMVGYSWDTHDPTYGLVAGASLSW